MNRYCASCPCPLRTLARTNAFLILRSLSIYLSYLYLILLFAFYLSSIRQLTFVSETCLSRAHDTQARRPCGEVCGDGNAYAALPGSVRTVGGAGPDGVLQMQLELLRGGPGVVSFVVTDDFFGYAGGVYAVPPNATEVGGHAVALVGWGVDGAGVPYWVCQNSWGPGWGEAGFFRCGWPEWLRLAVASAFQGWGGARFVRKQCFKQVIVWI